MNRRLDNASNPNARLMVIAAAVAVVVVAAAVYFFVIRDDSDSTAKKPTTRTTAAQTFTAPGQSFSFQYPGNFAQSQPPADGTVWIAGVGPYDLLRVKRIANKPTSPGRLQANLSRTLGVVPGSSIVAQGKETHANHEVVTFTVTSTVDSKSLTSRLYFFSANGVTWQFECESQAHADVINAACDNALSTFTALG